MRGLLLKTIHIPVFALCSICYAGGPIVLEGPDGSIPVTYKNPAITLHVESGDLRYPALTNANANKLVNNALSLWNSVNTSSIRLTLDETQINEDINTGNYEKYLPSVDLKVFNVSDGLNPVVYDSDGKIIDAFFGKGASDVTVGFAASILSIGSRYFREGYAVINGKNLGLSNLEFTLLIAHEIAHFFGLDHSQLDISNREAFSGNFLFCRTAAPTDYPVMYPFACRDRASLHADDISTVSSLYPGATLEEYFGTLQGYFTDRTGNAVPGANIWATNELTGESWSIVSDYRKQGSGLFRLLLPAGNYTLHANSINPEFVAGSGVGPYSLTSNDKSFSCPHPISEVSYMADGGSNPEIITIATGQVININFSVNDIDTRSCPSASSGKGSSAISHLTSGVVFLLLLMARRRISSGPGTI